MNTAPLALSSSEVHNAPEPSQESSQAPSQAPLQLSSKDVHNPPQDVTNVNLAQPVPVSQDTLKQIPDALRSTLDQSAVVPGPSGVDADGLQTVASVDRADPNTISVENLQKYDEAPAQVLGHEAVHVLTNNMPPTLQAKIPADPENDQAKYDISDAPALRAAGHTIATIPREKAATLIQSYIASGGKDKTLQPWVDDLAKLPQSTILPTTVKNKPGTINTTVRAPKGGQEVLQNLKRFSGAKKVMTRGKS